MSQDTWNAVDSYINAALVGDDPALDAALAASAEARLPPIAVAPNQGKLLHLLAVVCGARRILEIGTLAGYSTIWLARALPRDGRLVTLEYDPKHAKIARANLERAGLSSVVEVRVGAALDTLPKLAAEDLGPFDLVFIDADKPSTPDYVSWALELSRPGSLIVVDNVVRDGKVADPESRDESILGMRRTFDMLGSDPRLDATALQTVGIKGYDGLAVALVKPAA
ncbi:MAG TPA: O-methyltransferase [Acidimicrobiales bacterium]|nr:O-methyltransferase [Acidimicrobiales bacterium]